ncbi:MAG: TetR/AcrR family transcriptional regulator [bacterium]
MKKHKDKINQILDLVENLLLNKKINEISLNKIISESGLSKGGFFHYFKNKDELIIALTKRSMEIYKTLIIDEINLDPNPIGRFIRAQARLMRGKTISNPSYEYKRLEAIGQILLLSSTTNPKLLDTYRQCYSDFEQFYRNDGLTLSKSMLLNCAMDGLWMAKSIGVQNHSEEEINQLLEEIIHSSEKTI